MCKLIGGPNDERIKRVFWIERVVGGLKVETALRRRRCGFSWYFLSDVYDIDITDTCQASRIDHDIKMIIQPILKERVGDLDVQCPLVVSDQLRGFEPRVVTLLIDLLFNYIENSLPRIHSLVTRKGVRYPQLFPQLWKTDFKLA